MGLVTAAAYHTSENILDLELTGLGAHLALLINSLSLFVQKR